ncbi:MAG: hypothetical protein NC123_17030 [Butyrivibrio sp.]|nr:hypothetical protein [Acetatifactor muris]MCM1561223.1 hypothetical protein [Butyrivibrio sp.]
MHEYIYKGISNAIVNALSPLTESQVEYTSKVISSINETLQESLRNLTAFYNSNSAIESAKYLSEICRSILPAINSCSAPIENLDFLKDLNFQEYYVELTKNDCDSINTILESSNSSSVPPKTSKGKMSIPDFVKSVLIPILMTLAQMLYTNYHNKLDALESQKRYIEERQLHEDEIQLLREQIHLQEQELQTITDYAQSLEETLNMLNNCDCENTKEHLLEIPKSDSAFSVSPELSYEVPEFLHEVPEFPDKDPDYSDPIVDESDNH